MKLFARAKPVQAPERRAGPRTRVDCIAALLMPSGDRPGRLFDISATGARLSTQDPPAAGCSGILDWTIHEAFCRVTWSKPGMCGVEFDKPISAEVLKKTIEKAPAGSRAMPAQANDDGAHTTVKPGEQAPTRRFC
ncbi:PilZ domain-containing protein [Erythrobacter alti]|uniref:PilZ domain-containing protein n=1 Tax=Erythrobacter alti TaxID=1896145 RepID=UPI0030F472AE